MAAVYHSADGTTVTSETLTTTGDIKAARFLAGAGTEAAPSYSFQNATGKGFYSPAASAFLRMSLSGSNLLTFTTTNISSSLAADIGSYITFNNDTSPSAFGAAQHNYAVNDNTSWLRVSASVASVDITGLLSNIGDGRFLPIINVGTSNNVVLKHENASSTAGNRFSLPSATDITLGPGDGVFLVYDGASSRWRAWGVAL